MSEIARLILLLFLAGAALTAIGGVAVWFMDEERRIRRSLTKVLNVTPEATVHAHGRGVGFAFSRSSLAVTWDQGAWCLVYRLSELVGAEVLVDGEVVGRAHRGEARRAIDRIPVGAAEVGLRLLFDDPAHPDFEITLWSDKLEARRGVASPALALQEANRWLARTESILRRQGAPATPAAPAVAAQPAPPPAPEAQSEPESEPDEMVEDFEDSNRVF